MLAAARERFAGQADVELVVHDLADPLPALGRFDLVVSGFAIHHLEDASKRALFGEVLGMLRPGGPFLNLEHVASATTGLHAAFMAAIDEGPGGRGPLGPAGPGLGSQAAWLTEIGFEDADCHWKWRELALVGGRRPL